jgi:chaperonin GroES
MEGLTMNLRPLADRVVVRPLEREEVTKSGIVLPDTAKEKPQEGVVEAVGNGRLIEASGKREPIDLAVGDRVIYSKYAGNEVKIDEQDLLILAEKDILAVVASNGKKK